MMDRFLIFVRGVYVDGLKPFWRFHTDVLSENVAQGKFNAYGVDNVFYVKIAFGVPPKRTGKEIERQLNIGIMSYQIYRGMAVRSDEDDDDEEDRLLSMCIS